MRRYIDVGNAVSYAISGLTRYIDGEEWIRTNEVRESLRTMPTADVRENVHGHWTDDCECSVCGFGVDPITVGSNYCPHCGADMRGEKQ